MRTMALAWLVAALLSGGPAAAQGDPLTLEEAIAAAAEGNPGLAARDAEARAAEAGVRESRAARWPTLEVTAGAARTTDPVAVFGGLLRQERFAERHFDPDFLNEPDPLDNYRGLVAVEQALWAGGGIAAGIEGAEREAEAVRLLRERARQELAFRVLDRYTGAVVAGQAMAVRRESLAAARENVRLTRDRFETGLVVESDLLQARVRESEAAAAVAEAERDAAIARAALNLEMGRALNTPFTLPERLPEDLVGPEDAPPAEPLEALVTWAVERRPDLQAVSARVEAARSALDGARAARLPRLGWGGSFEADAEDPSDDPGSHWSLGLGLTWTGFDGFAAGARTEAARARVEEAERLAELARLGVALEVESALRSIEAARLRSREATEAVALAERSAAIVRDRYREGLTTVVELLEAEALLSGSRTRELQARRELAVARGRLDLATGRP
jgi:outer membrane protein TolC